MSYSKDFKIMAVAQYRANLNNAKKTAKDLDVPVSTLRDWVKDEELMNDRVKLEADKVFETEIYESSRHLAKKLTAKIEATIDKEDKLIDLVRSYEILHKIKATKKDDKSREDDYHKVAPEEVIESAIEQLVGSYEQTNEEESI